MGRSVNYDSDASVVCYTVFESEDENGDDCSWEWDMFVENLQDIIQEKYKSFNPEDNWVGNELHSILESQLAQVIISEYCGLVSISLSPKIFDSGYSDDSQYQNLANSWCDRVANNFQTLINKSFGGLNKVGTFSNGESVFEYA